MLNQETKRKIDSCRDMLVGKLPDPKAQIEQITYALIYKFMGDMDKASIEMGGKASFFVNGYEEYAWDKLMSQKLGGSERLALYSEAIGKLSLNPHLPQLFRDIFKDAFLPYRDPETLNMFLKEIDWFTYNHSEDLGDAFEYLLSVMGSQGDAGQFRTPRHIIGFIVEVIDPQKDETILDPACGTAGFLISSYKHILKKNTGEKPGDKLTPDERTTLMNQMVGYDISPDMARLSLVNMYLHGFQGPHIYEYDTLTDEARWDDSFDVIMANPPFMSPKGGIRPHKRFSIQANRSEVLFVDYIAEHLNANGRAGVIVPEGIIFQSGNAYKSLRKMLVENYLFCVVSLPSGVFNPYSGVKTSILLMDKIFAKQTDKILFVKIENDGFDLGAQRREIPGSDFPKALTNVNDFAQSVRNNKEYCLPESPDILLVSKQQLAENGDYNLSMERYKTQEVRQTKWPMVELREVAAFTRGPFGSSIKRSVCVPKGINTYKVYEQGNIIQNDFHRGEYYITEEQFKDLKRFELYPGDIVITCAGTLGRTAIVPEGIEKGIINSVLMRVRNDDKKILIKYLIFLLNSPQIQSGISNKATGVAINNMFATSELKIFKIPLPSLDVQQEIIAEIESYQKIIDGARQVVENYKPQIKINPEWPMVELGDDRIFTIYSGGTPASDNTEYWSGNNNWATLIDLPQSDYVSIIRSTQRKISNSGLKNSSAVMLPIHSIIVSSRATIGRVAVNEVETATNQGFKNIVIQDRTKAHYHFIAFMAKQLESKMNEMASGGTFKEISKTSFSLLKIPLPPLDVQQEIVAQIEKEQQLVDANKQLIQIYEQKIKTKIAGVWET